MNASPKKGLSRAQMAWRAARDIAEGSYVNLGIGIPEMVAQYVSSGSNVTYHTENGVLGFGPAPAPGAEDPDLINAGKKAVTILPGAAFFHHADSFAMIRGGHIDLTILGAFQVAQNGDLANWRVGDDAVPAVGGAMDLVSGAKAVFILTEHCARDAAHKLVERCTYPLTGAGVVDRIFTDLAVIDIVDNSFLLRELVPALSVGQLQELTGAPLRVADDLRPLKAPDDV